MSENESEKDTEATKEFSRRDSLGVFGREQAVRLTISSQAAISASIIAIFASPYPPAENAHPEIGIYVRTQGSGPRLSLRRGQG